MTTFTKNEVYAKEMADTYADRYGEYLFTYTSDTGQVIAELFHKGDMLFAHIDFRDDITASNVTDEYHADLRRKAAELGFAGKFKMLYRRL